MQYYLIYISSSNGLLTKGQLDNILEGSRRNNAAMGITGMLLYYGGNIIQLLEGEEEKVKQLYQVIAQDERHKGIIKLLDGYSEERIFPDWSMGFRVLSGEQYANLPVLDQSDGAVALSLLRQFHSNNRTN